MHKKNFTLVAALLLTGCGGGGTDDTAVSATPPSAVPPVAVAPLPSVPPPMTIAPSPIVAPVDPGPAKPPAGSPPSAQPPTPAPQPAEGDYIPGKTVKAAMASGDGLYQSAYEVDPATGLPDRKKDLILLSITQLSSGWFQQSIPYGFKMGGSSNVHSYPQRSVLLGTSYSAEGRFTLAQQATSGYAGDTAFVSLVRSDGPLEIRDDSKFLLNTTAAEWRGVDGSPDFLQLQISSSAQSNTVFKLCLHMSMEGVRRLACTLHDRNSGSFRGVQVLDDSAGLGVIEYRSVR